MKQHYKRTYERGRSTDGWGMGDKLTELPKPGDVLIALSHRFKAENLIRVVESNYTDPAPGFYYKYANASASGTMYYPWPDLFDDELYCAIDRRPKPKPSRIENLPPWLYYA